MPGIAARRARVSSNADPTASTTGRFASSALEVALYIEYSGYMNSEIAIDALAALAQGTRLDTFRLLVKHEPGGLSAGEVARRLGVPQNTMSAHLAILARAGLVRAERQSRSIIYRADLGALRALTVFLVKDCCEGRPELCAPLIEDLIPRR